MLEITGLVKRYGGILAVDRCSLQVPPGTWTESGRTRPCTQVSK
jgi:ABC-type branched-subunit amino acid transport system ATPase component